MLGFLRCGVFAILGILFMAGSVSAQSYENIDARGLPKLKDRDPRISEILPSVREGDGVAIVGLVRRPGLEGRVQARLIIKSKERFQFADVFLYEPEEVQKFSCANGSCSCGGSGIAGVVDCLNMIPHCSSGTYEGGTTGGGGYEGSCKSCFPGFETGCPPLPE